MRAMDWSATPLGPVETWPSELRLAVNLCLSSLSPVVIWWGSELSTLYNDIYRPTLGASKHPALGKPGREIWPEVWPTIGPMLEGVMEKGKSTWAEDQLLPLDRYGYLEEVYFSYSYTPIRVETGEICGVFSIATETTAKVLAERRTRVARDMAAAIVEARTAEEACERATHVLASDAADVPFALVYLLDADGQRAHLAGSAGLEPGTTLAPLTVDLADAPRRGKAAEAVPWPLGRVARTNQRAMLTDLAARWGDETVRAGRELTPHSAMVLPVTEPGQSSPSALLVAGVSPMRVLNDDYEGFYELLAGHLSSGLAAAHAYEAERKRAEALAEIDRAKTTFFSNVSHEFRTPLTLLLGPLEDSLGDSEHPLPPAQRERLEIMRRSGVRLLKLVNTLLDFARIEAGRTRASYEPTDLAAYTAELASSFRSLVEKAGMALEVECPPLADLPEPVYVDREMWEKIVLNLLSNAFKFTFEGEIAVSLRRAGESVELTVRDTGTGIPPEELPRLFERFHRVQGARSRSFEGSGIGLALVQELVHLHGGTIAATSEMGQGTTFTVRLPVGAAHLPAERIRADSTLAATLSATLGAVSYVEEARRWLPEGGEGTDERVEDGRWLQEDITAPSLPTARATDSAAPARILLADDNADLREYLHRLLSERYTVEVVANGAAALAAAHARPPDLVLSDVMMPELDGFGLLHALRQDTRTRAIPIILLSARAGEEATIEGLEAGADDYLIKPFSAREVLARVASHLEIARLRQEALMRAQELETTFEAITDAVFVYDGDGRITRTNAAARCLFGLDAHSDYETRSPHERAEMVHTRDEHVRTISVEESGLSRLLRGEVLTGANALDVRLGLADGRELQLSISGAPLRDATGAVVGAVAVSRDVTERRALERRTRESEERLRGILDLLPVGVSFVDDTGKAVIVNQAVRTIWGEDVYVAEAREEYGEYKAWWPATGERVKAEEWGLARALATGEVSIGEEAEIETSDGTRKTILSSNAPLRDETGAIVGGMSVIVDITERKQFERRTHEALDALLAMAQAVVAVPGEATVEAGTTASVRRTVEHVITLAQHVIGGQYTTVVLVNPETEAIQPLAVVGLSPEIEKQWWRDVARKRFGEYYPPDVLRRFYAEEVVVLDFAGEPPIQGQDYFGLGTILIVPIRLDARRFLFFAVEVRDRTTFTSQERDLAQAAARLAALVLERDRLTREREAAQASELAATEAKRQMDEFLGIASHELRTPLTSITANVQMAERWLSAVADALPASVPEELDGRLRRVHLVLERSGRQVVRLDRLVGDLLDASRIQAGKLELRIDPCELTEIAREAVQEQRVAWSTREIPLALPRRAELPLFADADRIGQVVTNLLANALKYSKADQPVAVRVRTRGQRVRVEVMDHGPGLSRKQQARLFERFYRVPGIAQQSGSGVGLGLGLHICKTIIERHGGTIGVESQVGQGSTFWFELPLAEPVAEE
jgi:PAS domain S-box-containing protein